MKITFRNYQEEYKKFLREIEGKLLHCGFDKEKAHSYAISCSGLFTPEGPSMTARDCVVAFFKKCNNGEVSGYSPYMFPKSKLLIWKNEYKIKVTLSKAMVDDTK